MTSIMLLEQMKQKQYTIPVYAHTSTIVYWSLNLVCKFM